MLAKVVENLIVSNVSLYSEGNGIYKESFI